MGNQIRSAMREFMIEDQKLDIPYNAKGFKEWLIESGKMSEKDACKQVENIRTADIEMWEPEDPEIFDLIAKWINDGENAKESLRNLYNGFVVELIAGQIEDLCELKSEVTDESIPFLNDVIKAYQWYLKFMENTLDCEADKIPFEEYDLKSIDDTWQKYESIPLEDEFKNYLDELKYTEKTRNKMLSNLRKFNHLVIDNGRGDSKVLENMVQKASEGKSIYSTRYAAHQLFHYALSYTKDFNISETALRGGMTALNTYIKFLIDHFKNKK